MASRHSLRRRRRQTRCERTWRCAGTSEAASTVRVDCLDRRVHLRQPHGSRRAAVSVYAAVCGCGDAWRAVWRDWSQPWPPPGFFGATRQFFWSALRLSVERQSKCGRRAQKSGSWRKRPTHRQMRFGRTRKPHKLGRMNGRISTQDRVAFHRRGSVGLVVVVAI
jgi:hypothetical protein